MTKIEYRCRRTKMKLRKKIYIYIFRNRYYKGIFSNIVDGRFTTEDCSGARKIMCSASI